jgi:hypothetical protein
VFPLNQTDTKFPARVKHPFRSGLDHWNGPRGIWVKSAGRPINDGSEARKFADLTRREPTMNWTGARTGRDDAPESLVRIDQIATTPKLARSHDIKIDDSHRPRVSTASDGVGLIAGALIAASGLTWIVISALPLPVASMSVGGSSGSLNASAYIPDSKKGDRLQIRNPIIREALPASSRGTSLGVAPPAPSERKYSTDMQQQTASIGAKVGGLEAPVKLVPTPETKPTTIAGWTLREVTNGTTVLDGPDGTWRATRGDTVPGIGRVDSIFRWGNRLMVATSKGLISTP